MPLSTSAERNSFAQDLFTPLPARYDRLAEILSFGQNGRWRRAMVDQIGPAPGNVVLDVASGTAGVAIQLADRTAARVVGVDLTEQMLRRGQLNVAAAGQAGRIGLIAGRAEQLPLPDASVDALTFTYLLRYVDEPRATLAELARVVRPGGRVASLEFCVPPSPFWRAAWWNISAHYRKYPVTWTEQAWHDAGFTDVGVKLMSLGGGLVMWGTRSGG